MVIADAVGAADGMPCHQLQGGTQSELPTELCAVAVDGSAVVACLGSRAICCLSKGSYCTVPPSTR